MDGHGRVERLDMDGPLVSRYLTLLSWAECVRLARFEAEEYQMLGCRMNDVKSCAPFDVCHSAEESLLRLCEITNAYEIHRSRQFLTGDLQRNHSTLESEDRGFFQPDFGKHRGSHFTT